MMVERILQVALSEMADEDLKLEKHLYAGNPPGLLERRLGDHTKRLRKAFWDVLGRLPPQARVAAHAEICSNLVRDLGLSPRIP